MLLLIETFHSSRDMGNRIVGKFTSKELASKAMIATRNNFWRSISPSDYAGYCYKTRDTRKNMAWVDVVCGNEIHGHTWTIIDTNSSQLVFSRYLG